MVCFCASVPPDQHERLNETDLLIRQRNGNNILKSSFHLFCLIAESNVSIPLQLLDFSKFLTLPLGHKPCYIKGYFHCSIWHKYLSFMTINLIQARFSLAPLFSTVPYHSTPCNPAASPQWFGAHPL